jgi:hypothetical protein
MRNAAKPTHLFPEEVGQTNCAIMVATQDEQADKHNQKQGHVANYRGEETKYAGLGLDWKTGELCRGPIRAKLRCDKPSVTERVGIGHSPVRHLFTTPHLYKNR